MSEEERRARVALSMVWAPGDPRLGTYLERHGPLDAWRAVQAGRLPGGPGLADRVAAADPAAQLDRAAAAGVRLVCPGDPDWPQALSAAAYRAVAPLLLWVRGDLAAAGGFDRAVAIVGSRAASDYGCYVAGELGAGLADRGWTVVSGGAYGIDAAAHRGALAAGGPTVAVLACGVDVAYPRGHASLFDRIAAAGALVSEWPLGATPHRARFLVRNRAIAMLTAGTVIVEAARRSGALSTAGYARRYGRHLMAVPGPVTSALSAGCHDLLRTGAVLVSSPAEVAEELEPLRADRPVEPTALSAEADRVLAVVPRHTSRSAPEIAVAAAVEPGAVLGILGELAGAGLVRRHPDGWRRDPVPAPVLDLDGP